MCWGVGGLFDSSVFLHSKLQWYWPVKIHYQSSCSQSKQSMPHEWKSYADWLQKQTCISTQSILNNKGSFCIHLKFALHIEGPLSYLHSHTIEIMFCPEILLCKDDDHHHQRKGSGKVTGCKWMEHWKWKECWQANGRTAYVTLKRPLNAVLYILFPPLSFMHECESIFDLVYKPSNQYANKHVVLSTTDCLN